MVMIKTPITSVSHSSPSRTNNQVPAPTPSSMPAINGRETRQSAVAMPCGSR